MGEIPRLLSVTGFDILVEREITSNVLISLDRESVRKRGLDEIK